MMADCKTQVINKRSDIRWTPFLRQFLVCSGLWIAYFKYGLIVGAPTVIIPQIRREANSTDAITTEMASWLSSAVGFSGFICVIICTMLSRLIGRKIPFILGCADCFIAFLVFYCSSNVTQILISQMMQGFFSAAQIVVSVIIITEYTSPKYRGLFLTIKCATMYWGIWVANAVGTFCHWKTIGLIGLVCAAYTLTTVLFWPESPYWLAARGRYQDCASSHRWLKGCDDDAEKELNNLINSQKEYMRKNEIDKASRQNTLKDWYMVITDEEFYKPTLISLLTGFISATSGKLVCTVYAIDIIKKVTGDESTAYTGMLILDGITVTSMYGGCVLSKFLKRRTMLIGISSVGIMFLYILALYLYLIKLSVIIENNYVSMCLLVFFNIAISCGPLIMSVSIYGELIPIRSRNLATFIIAMVAKGSFSITMKTAPSIFKTFGLHGAFLTFAISSTVILTLIYIYLPETKDKTLQEITDEILGRQTRKTLSHEEVTNLMFVKNNVA